MLACLVQKSVPTWTLRPRWRTRSVARPRWPSRASRPKFSCAPPCATCTRRRRRRPTTGSCGTPASRSCSWTAARPVPESSARSRCCSPSAAPVSPCGKTLSITSHPTRWSAPRFTRCTCRVITARWWDCLSTAPTPRPRSGTTWSASRPAPRTSRCRARASDAPKKPRRASRIRRLPLRQKRISPIRAASSMWLASIARTESGTSPFRLSFRLSGKSRRACRRGKPELGKTCTLCNCVSGSESLASGGKRNALLNEATTSFYLEWIFKA